MGWLEDAPREEEPKERPFQPCFRAIGLVQSSKVLWYLRPLSAPPGLVLNHRGLSSQGLLGLI